MTSPRISVRTLYLLALFQLVAGPLVLGLVVSFTKITVREAPQQGLAKAVRRAWQSREVQAALQAVAVTVAQEPQGGSKSSPPKPMKSKMKIIGVGCAMERPVPVQPAVRGVVCAALKTWTPAWPLAPPGTPPRLG